ncbi:MAG: hypothetical protein ACRDH9_07390 [Actinomycetota bacterium]
MSGPEPEREMVRRALPFAIPAVIVAVALGVLLDSWNAGWSAAIGVGVVAANLIAHGLSLAWAARISPTMIFAVAMGGFALRLATILIILLVLNGLPWFSPVAFVAAVVPATLLLLVFEAKVMSGRMQANLWTRAEDARR